MTAIVGVLNKHAVAVAADSAATINGTLGRKVLNQANKIITISKYHPIAVMIYSSSSFLGTPWDVIVKLYRDNLKEKDFNSVSDYISDFIKFLSDNSFFCSEGFQRKVLRMHIFRLYQDIERKAIAIIGGEVTDSNKPYLFKTIKDELSSLKEKLDKSEPCEGLKSYTFEKFEKYSIDILDELYNYIVNHTGASPELYEHAKQTAFSFLKSSFNLLGYTGLVFVGYGKFDIFPSLKSINVSTAFDVFLKYSYDKQSEAVISENNMAAICPFAQTDVMETILTGIDPSVKHFVSDLFFKSLNAYSTLVSNTIKANNGDSILSTAIEKLDISGIRKVFDEAINNIIGKQYISPLVDTVAYLEKEDMAEMAESLISLTFLKRRMMSSEETVGGPVDVAIISKSDGFVWIKRKHYFQPDLNHHFFSNYYIK